MTHLITFPFGTVALRYGSAIVILGLTTLLSEIARLLIEPVPSAPFFVAVAIVARYAGLGPSILAAVISALFIEYLFLAPPYELLLDTAHTLVVLAMFVVIALVINALNLSLRSVERERARLEGVILTAREMADRLNNSLAVAMVVIEAILDHPDVPSSLVAMVSKARARLEAAAEDISRFQRVVRVETKSGPAGLALDLERSIQSGAPSSALSGVGGSNDEDPAG